MNGAQIVYDIFYLVIFNIVVAGMEFNFFLRFSEHKQKLVPYICYISLTLLVSVLEIRYILRLYCCCFSSQELHSC